MVSDCGGDYVNATGMPSISDMVPCGNISWLLVRFLT